MMAEDLDVYQLVKRFLSESPQTNDNFESHAYLFHL